ncbi:MAG TPA: hypothetical protein VJZ25_06045 [Gemmatimonadaceae bacterium]|nr:hypothetical protein [Gemmatimonadaceae bacterium]
MRLQPAPHNVIEAFRLLEIREVSRTSNNNQLGSADTAGEELCFIAQCSHFAIADDYKRWRRDFA